MTDAIWNVRTVVVELVAAPTARTALDILNARLEQAGFTPYSAAYTENLSAVFASTALDPKTEAATRRRT